MSQHNNANSRSMIAENVVYVNDGDRITFPRQDMTFIAPSGAAAITCPRWSDLPAGLRFTVENISSGTLSITSGGDSDDSADLSVSQGSVAYFYVSSVGSIHAATLTVVAP